MDFCYLVVLIIINLENINFGNKILFVFMIKKCFVGIYEKKRINIIYVIIVINIYRSVFLYFKNIFRVKVDVFGFYL